MLSFTRLDEIAHAGRCVIKRRSTEPSGMGMTRVDTPPYHAKPPFFSHQYYQYRATRGLLQNSDVQTCEESRHLFDSLPTCYAPPKIVCSFLAFSINRSIQVLISRACLACRLRDSEGQYLRGENSACGDSFLRAVKGTVGFSICHVPVYSRLDRGQVLVWLT